MHIFIFSPTALVRGNPARAKFATESHVDTLVMVVLHCCYLITHGDIYRLGQQCLRFWLVASRYTAMI